MKIFIILTYLILPVVLFSQNGSMQSVDSCNKKKPLPCRISANEREGSLNIDTITAARFKIILESLNRKMSSSQQLNSTEDKTLVLVMNTFEWSEFDNQSNMGERFPELVSINKLFNSKYRKDLSCKYSVCIGPGFSPYYRELGVQYLGNPYVCDRYFIKN